MAQVRGFNVGVTVSLGDMELALDYLNDSDVFMPDIENIIKSKTQNSELSTEYGSSVLMSDNATVEYDEDDAENRTSIDSKDNEDEIDIVEDDSYFEDDGEDDEEDIVDETEDDTDEEVEAEVKYENTEADEDGYDEYADTYFENEEEDTDESGVYSEKTGENIEESDEDEGDYFGDRLEEEDDEDSYFESEEDEEECEEVVEVRQQIKNVQKPAVNNTPKNPTPTIDNSNVKSARELELERKLQEALDKLNKQEKESQKAIDRPMSNSQVRTTSVPSRQIVDNSRHFVDKTNRPVDKYTRPTMQTNKVVGARPNNTAQTLQKPARAQEVNRVDDVQKRIDRYSSMDIDALYKEVRRFMQDSGVSKTTIDRQVLEREFGAANVKKLLLKSYIIIMGRGITIGR